ncbi:MAG: PCRF domain-containing protein, partial [Parcubacteria group bacterium]|nr:PCRF domain-containing protein [Parcubacteria group bacterium]
MEREKAALEAALSEEHIWKDQKSAHEMSERLRGIREELDTWSELEKSFFSLKTDIDTLEALEREGGADAALQREFLQRLHDLHSRFDREEINLFFSGKYDKGNAILAISSGAGGRDAQDWAGMLLRMYQRYAEKKSFQAVLLDSSRGEEGGTKSALVEVRGKYAFGYLRGEAGVHRLVRISPFSAQSLRHTSFASVEVLPDLSTTHEDIEIRNDDIELDTFRSSGPGGQYVNRRESAVRIRHKPSGIVISVQSERLQGQNKSKALALLKAKLVQRRDQEHRKELDEARGERKSVEWGSQIR